MEYLLGSKEEFWRFVDSVKEEDKVGVITHLDLDGFSSAIFLEEILNSKGIKIDSIFFTGYKLGMFNKILPGLENKGITKVFLTDVYADGTDPEGFEKLKQLSDVFVIDHHPVINKDAENTIKTEGHDCSAYAIFDLGKEIIDEKKWKILLYATMIAEMSYKSPENMEFIRKDYPDVTEDNILDSLPGELCKNVAGALIYFSSLKKNLKEAYDLLKKQDFEELRKYNEEVQKEIDFYLDKIKKEAEHYPEKDLYFYYFNPKFNVTSVVGTLFSNEHKDSSLIVVSDIDDKMMKVSARNQNKRQDMGALLKKGIQGLKDAVGGGHVPAAGGSFLKKDLNKFKENILS
jgi:single-stranded DNA-specific DHH superfamily exonuclease